jgi:hypothetical protein
MPLLLVAAFLLPQNEKDDGTSKLRAMYLAEAAKYKFALEGDEKPLVLGKKSIMTWTGQEAGTVSGDVFIWSRNGRPEVIGCIGSLPTNLDNRRSLFHEFHSLSEGENNKLTPIPLGLSNRVWRPKQKSLPQPFPDAGQPKTSRTLRLVQMRRLARGFKPQMKESAEKTAIDNLRLLPQPLHRFDKNIAKQHPAVIDGAIFCYVWTRGTDPELLILIEARKTDAGTGWFYTPLRFTNRELWLNLNGKRVWEAPAADGKRTYAEPYITEWKYAGLVMDEPTPPATREAIPDK